MSFIFIFGSNRDNIESCRRNSRIGKGFSRNHVYEYIFYVSDKLGADIYHCRCNGYCCHRFAIFVISEAKRQVYQRNSWITCYLYRSAGGGGWGGGYLVCNRIIIKKNYCITQQRYLSLDIGIYEVIWWCSILFVWWTNLTPLSEIHRSTVSFVYEHQLFTFWSWERISFHWPIYSFVLSSLYEFFLMWPDWNKVTSQYMMWKLWRFYMLLISS